MKKFVITLALLCPLTFFAQKFEPETCKCKGKIMFGKVEVVDISEDIKVKIVNNGEELQVHRTAFPSRCGEWEFVKIGADFKVRFVDIGQDITICYSSFIDQKVSTPPSDRSQK